MKEEKYENQPVSESVRRYMASIGAKGGAAGKGTEVAKERAMKGVAARLANAAARMSGDPVPATPPWVNAVQKYLAEVAFKQREDKERFNRLLARAVQHNDMRKLGSHYEPVKRLVKKQ